MRRDADITQGKTQRKNMQNMLELEKPRGKKEKKETEKLRKN
jgi:hypothetical protein